MHHRRPAPNITDQSACVHPSQTEHTTVFRRRAAGQRQQRASQGGQQLNAAVPCSGQSRLCHDVGKESRARDDQQQCFKGRILLRGKTGCSGEGTSTHGDASKNEQLTEYQGGKISWETAKLAAWGSYSAEGSEHQTGRLMVRPPGPSARRR